MASSSGASSGSSAALQNSGSEGDLKQIMDQRKRKRMISNRESARRSRMRKQKHLDDLMAQASQLRSENSQIGQSVTLTSQLYLNLEAENSILRAQMAELSSRLESLNEIINYVSTANWVFETDEQAGVPGDSWGSAYLTSQPLVAPADTLMY